MAHEDTREALAKLRPRTYVVLRLDDGSELAGWYQGIEDEQVRVEEIGHLPKPESKRLAVGRVEAVVMTGAQKL